MVFSGTCFGWTVQAEKIGQAQLNQGTRKKNVDSCFPYMQSLPHMASSDKNMKSTKELRNMTLQIFEFLA